MFELIILFFVVLLFKIAFCKKCKTKKAIMDLHINDFKPLIEELVSNISTTDYNAIFEKHQYGRTNIDDIKRVVSEYNHTITILPDNAFKEAKVYYIEKEKRLDIYIPLWTIEEGRSDLVLFLSGYIISGIPKIEINDLLVY